MDIIKLDKDTYMEKTCACGNSIPRNRKKYCSVECIKRAWYLRNTNAKSFFKNDDRFWDTETGKGFRWERWVAEKIGARHLVFNHSGCDLDWLGKKIDVKACELYRRKLHHGKPTSKNTYGWWVFNRNKEKDCDYFVCVCLENGKLHKWYFIPANEFPRKGITIGKRSKYDTYLVKE